MDDGELLRRWRGGDKRAGNRLVERHFPTLFRFFRNKAAGEIDDLVQRTFLRCLEGQEGFRGESSFRTWLVAIARNELIAHYRARGTAIDPTTQSLALADDAPSASALLDERGDHRLLLRSLRHLALDDQIALELFYFEELPGPEIARVLGVPEGTVRTRLRRAREALAAKAVELAAEGEALRTSTEDLGHWLESLRDSMRHEGVRRR